MIAFRVVLTAMLLSLTAAANATESSSELAAAQERLRDGDLDGALSCLEPLLGLDRPNDASQRLARALASRILHSRGEEHFRQGRISASIADFDRQIQLEPQREAEHWQRGIALYYAGDFAAGAQQFKLHQTVNPQDVENAAWHFQCESRCSHATFEEARERLIQVTRDSRAPMSQIHQMFAGLMTPEEVLQVGEQAGGEAQFYADLYVGLYYEALGRDAESLQLMRNAADNPAARDSYMGDVARVHVALRTDATEKEDADATKSEETRKILLLAGEPSHGYGAHDHWAGCNLLAQSLNNSGLPIEAQVYRSGWPRDAKAFDGVDCVVMYGDGGGGHMVTAHLKELDALAKRGVGIVCLHYAVEAPKGPTGDKFLEWIGGYFEADWSVNPHWTAHFNDLPEHQITRGVKPFEINDEWYYHMRFRDEMRNVTPILTALPPAETLSRPDGSHSGNPAVRAAIKRGEPQHVAWAVVRDDGGRGFGFTGGHVHWNWSDPNFRKLVLNAIVWSAGVEVPPEGVSDQPKTLADLEANPDEEIPADFNREEIRKSFSLPPDVAVRQ